MKMYKRKMFYALSWAGWKEVVGKIMRKHRGSAPETMWGSSLEDKNRLHPC